MRPFFQHTQQNLKKIANYKKLDAYILKKYISSFLLAITLIIVIVITFDVSEKMDDFLHNNAPLKEIIFQYYLNFIPEFINLYSPLFIFISVIFFTSKMAGNTEIIAILGSGISYRRFLRPYLHGALIVALLVAILGNFVIPISNRTQSVFDAKYIHTFAANRNYFSNIHFQSSPNTLVYAESYDQYQRTVYKVQIDQYDEKLALTQRLTADRLIFDTVEKQWEAYEYAQRDIKEGREHLLRQSKTKIDLELRPDDFNNAGKHITTMNTPDLIRHIKREIMRGSSMVTFAKIELYQRFLNPIAIVVMTFIGVAVSSRKSRGGIGLHLAIGISIAFAFIVFMKISTVFAINGNLAPFMAVIFPQMIFGIAALFLIRTVPK